MKEEWKPITGFEGEYEISNQGRVKSHHKRNGYDAEGHILKNNNQKGDYLRIILRLPNKKTKSTSIHKLVYEHFGGDIPNGYHIHHMNGNKQDNRIENLQLLSPSQHVLATHGMNPNSYDGMNNYNKYEKPQTVFMYDLDGMYLGQFPNAKSAERVTGVCSRNILQVASKTEYKPNKTRSQAGGFIWRFKEDVDKDNMYQLREQR